MKALFFFALLAGCTKPCEGTAKHAVAMMRYCVDTKDEATIAACSAAYDGVRDSLTRGVCSAEVTR